MGLAVYRESQAHGRTYVGPEVGESLSKVLEAASGVGLLAGIHVFGDTMFNMVQLRRLEEEIENLATVRPQLVDDVHLLRNLIGRIVRDRGYMWISGD
jgi:hypothetical protein